MSLGLVTVDWRRVENVYCRFASDDLRQTNNKRAPWETHLSISTNRKGGLEMKIYRVIAIFFALMAGMIVNPYSGSAQQTVPHEFNRESCYASCRCESFESVQPCFQCKQECDRKYWREFERETGGDRRRQMERNQ
jgi:hypothetical protein